MTPIQYVGPFAEGVEIVDSGQWAEPGVPVEVDDDLAERLLEQPANWQPAGGGVPNGTIEAVLKWVGDDPEKATAALVAERSSTKPRESLITQLEAVAAAAAGDTTDPEGE